MLIYSSKQPPSKLPPNLEAIAIKLCFAGNHKISICTVYIPPNPNVACFNLLFFSKIHFPKVRISKLLTAIMISVF